MTAPLRLAPLLLALACLPVLAGPKVTIETRPDGTVVSYDPTSRAREENWSTIWYELKWAKPRDCGERGCVVVTSIKDAFDCATYRRGRIASIDLGPDGKMLNTGEREPRMVFIPDNDNTGRVLFNAACGAKGERKSS